MMIVDDHVDPSHSGIASFLVVAAWLTFVCVIQNCRSLRKTKQRAKNDLDPGETYKKAMKNGPTWLTMLCAPWIGWLFFLLFTRRKQKAMEDLGRCPVCGLHTASCSDFIFSAKEQMEMEKQSKCYQAFRCQAGHTFVRSGKGKKYHYYHDCPSCGAHLCQEKEGRIVKSPTYTHEGIREIEQVCLFCGKKSRTTTSIPKKTYTSFSDSSYSGGWSSGGSSYSGGSSGGSFGGGSSGGGGASGRW